MENLEFSYEQGFLDSKTEAWVRECRKRFEKWFVLTGDVNSLAVDTIFQFDAHNKLIHEMLLATLYLRTLHNYQGTILMAERGMMAQGRIMARSILDSVFPLVAIAKDQEFAATYAENHTLQQVKYFRKVQKLTTARLPDVDAPENLARAAELQEQIDAKGIKHISTESIAERAGLGEWYLTAYSLLSGTVHARAGDLEEYLVLAPDDEIKEFDWGPKTKGMELLLMSAMESMLMGVEHAVTISPRHPSSRLEELRARLVALVQSQFGDMNQEAT